MRLITDISEYHYSDIRPSDRVLDIGANCGAFSLAALKLCWHVTAIEPVTFKELFECTAQSGELGIGSGLRLYNCALGDGKIHTIHWDEHVARVQTYPLDRLIEIAGGCDFLKCDAEGAEWTINPVHLKGIRRIEMELHCPPICALNPNSKPLTRYIRENYNCTVTDNSNRGVGVIGVLHAEVKKP